MEHMINAHKGWVKILGEDEALSFANEMRKVWGVTDNDLFMATPLGKSITSQPQVRKLNSLISICGKYDLNIIEKIQSEDVSFREGYNIAVRIKKMMKSGDVLPTFEVALDQTAISEYREEMKHITKLLDEDSIEEMVRGEISGIFGDSKYLKIVIKDPLAEFREYIYSESSAEQIGTI